MLHWILELPGDMRQTFFFIWPYHILFDDIGNKLVYLKYWAATKIYNSTNSRKKVLLHHSES